MTITDWDATTYWNGKGKYQKKCDKIQELIPLEGSCTDPKLEKIRVYLKLYYDWHNGNVNLKLTSDEIEVLELAMEVAMDHMIRQF